MRALLKKLRRDQRGIAVTEFALWTTAFFFLVMGAFDFGGAYLQRGQINEAISAAAVHSFNDRDNVNFSALPAYVRNFSDNQSLAVTVSCNGTTGSCTNLNRTCACLKTDGSFVASTCNATCTGTGMTSGSTAGYYLTISATHPFQPMMLPKSVLSSTDMQHETTVRLQ